MPLLNFWKSAKEDVLQLRIEQIVSNAGDGILRDQSSCSTELRNFFSIAPVECLFSYAKQCLENLFKTVVLYFKT